MVLDQLPRVAGKLDFDMPKQIGRQEINQVRKG